MVLGTTSNCVLPCLTSEGFVARTKAYTKAVCQLLFSLKVKIFLSKNS